MIFIVSLDLKMASIDHVLLDHPKLGLDLSSHEQYTLYIVCLPSNWDV